MRKIRLQHNNHLSIMKKKYYPMCNHKAVQICYLKKVLAEKKIIIKITSYLRKYLLSLIKPLLVNKNKNKIISLQMSQTGKPYYRINTYRHNYD